MGKKIVIVGGVAGGASTAARLRRHSEEDRIIMFEKGPHVSFSNCSLPYHLSKVVENLEDLVLMDPEHFLKQYNIQARINSEVVAINREKKKVTVVNHENDETYEESYDKLVLAPGAFPIVPDFPGLDKVSTFTLRNVVDIGKIMKFAQELPGREIAIIGGGFIGVEVAENLVEAGFKVTLIEAVNQILRPFDYDMVQIFHKVLLDHGVKLYLGEKVEGFAENQVLLASGEKIQTSGVILAIGVAPDTKLAKEAGLSIGETGAIEVDHNYQTSDKNIYAVGDAVEVYNSLTHSMTKLSLAGPAVKQGRAVADHIHSQSSRNPGYIGSSAIKVFEYNGAATGLNEALIKAQNVKVKYDILRIILSDKVGLMPDASPLHMKVLYEVPTGKILGGQAIGKGDVTKRVDILATVIKFGGTLEDLKELELCYAPPFSTAKDLVNYAGYVGSNLLNRDFKQINVDQVRALVEKQEYFLDVREVSEFEYAHIKGAVNIPLSTLRENVSLIPKDRNVYVHCRTGQRSYNAVKALQNMGFQNVYNVAGSFLGLSFYEYFNDVTQKRESILTKYNFR